MRLWLKLCFRSTHVAEQHMFSMSPSILAFNLTQFKGFFFAFREKIGYFEGWGQFQIVLGSTQIVQQLLFSMFPSILTVDFDLILGLFLTCWSPNGQFLDLMWDPKTILRSTHLVKQLSFSMLP